MNYHEIREKIKTIAENYKDEPTAGWISGDGPIPCKIMFLGEAPGKTEVEAQKPFVGMAGKTFEHYLNSIGLTRNEEFLKAYEADWQKLRNIINHY